MTIEARFEQADDAEQRSSARRTLRLGVVGRFGTEGGSEVTVRNLSASGLLLETQASLSEGESFVVDLPEAGEREALVVWADTPHYGCRFAFPIGPSALAAAQLRGDAVDVADVADESDARAGYHGEDFPARLRRLRKERGLSLSEIAASLGVSKPTVWAWEHGKARPVDRRMTALAEVLGVTAGGLEPMPSSAPEVLGRSRQQIAEAYGVEPIRVRIMIEL